MQSDCCAYLRKNRRRSNNQSLGCSRHWRLDLKHECGRHWRLNLEHGCLLPYEEIAREVLDPAGVADDAKAHITSGERLIATFATRCAWPHLEHECLLSQFFKPSWPSQIGSRKSGKAHGQTGSDGRQEQKSIVTPGVPERVTRHVFSCFTPPQFNVRVFVDQYPYIIIHLTICQHFFLFHTKKHPFTGVF